MPQETVVCSIILCSYLALDASGELMDRTEIAAASGISYGTAGNVLTRLRGDGYVSDHSGLEGGKKAVELSEEGVRFVERFLAEYRRAITSHPPYEGDDGDDMPGSPTTADPDPGATHPLDCPCLECASQAPDTASAWEGAL